MTEHASDCALHNEPYKPNGPCDCGADKGRPVPPHGSGGGEVVELPDDVCRCGDRRREHADGGGACKLNGLGHGYAGYSCNRFRFAWRSGNAAS